LGTSAFDEVDILQIVTNNNKSMITTENYNQLKLFNF